MTYKDWLRTSKILFIADVTEYATPIAQHESCHWASTVYTIEPPQNVFWYKKTFLMLPADTYRIVYIVRNLRSAHLLVRRGDKLHNTDVIRRIT